jgi:hypothetical protein
VLLIPDWTAMPVGDPILGDLAAARLLLQKTGASSSRLSHRMNQTAAALIVKCASNGFSTMLTALARSARKRQLKLGGIDSSYAEGSGGATSGFP